MKREVPREREWSRAAARWAALVLGGVLAQGASAHPAPFSYVDLRLDDRSTSGTIVIHDFDAAHELGLAEPQALLDPIVARQRASEITRLIGERLRIVKDGEPTTLQWRPGVEILAEQQSLRFEFTLAPEGAASRVEVDTVLFPYDANHQTFVNLYEGARLERQAVLNANAHRLEHYVGTIQGRAAVLRRFVALGVEHILIGPDHLLFLLGLLLLGGSLWRLATIVTAFTVGHTVTLSLAALDVVRVAPSLVEPAIALSIVVVGVDNLLVGQRRAKAGGAPGASVDLRPWLAAAFGLIHGFGFAAVLREIGLPPGALGWSLAGFNVGVELGQLAAVVAAALLLAAVRRRDVVLAERIALAGSVAVVAAGLYWFAARIGLTA